MSGRLHDKIKLIGTWTFTLRNKRGKVILRKTIRNLIVTVGKAQVAGLLNGTASGAFKFLAIGTGTNAAAAGDTALQNEITTGGGNRITGTVSNITTTTTGDTARIAGTYNFTGSFNVTEAAVLNALVGGIMLNRAVFGAIAVTAAQSLQLRVDIKVA